MNAVLQDGLAIFSMTVGLLLLAFGLMSLRPASYWHWLQGGLPYQGWVGSLMLIVSVAGLVTLVCEDRSIDYLWVMTLLMQTVLFVLGVTMVLGWLSARRSLMQAGEQEGMSQKARRFGIPIGLLLCLIGLVHFMKS